MDAKDKRYTYDRFGSKGSRVGQAVVDIKKRGDAPQEVGETIQAMTQKYFDELMKAADNGRKVFDSPYYVVVLRKKETLAGMADNVLLHRYVARQTKPVAAVLRDHYPNADHDVYKIDSRSSEISLLWTLPTAQDSKTILKNKHLYDETLVKWIDFYNAGKLEESFP